MDINLYQLILLSYYCGTPAFFFVLFWYVQIFQEKFEDIIWAWRCSYCVSLCCLNMPCKELLKWYFEPKLIDRFVDNKRFIIWIENTEHRKLFWHGRKTDIWKSKQCLYYIFSIIGWFFLVSLGKLVEKWNNRCYRPKLHSKPKGVKNQVGNCESSANFHQTDICCREVAYPSHMWMALKS